MKTAPQQYRWQRADGSALIAAAVAAGVLGIMVTSYLAWVTNEYRLANRSHMWAEALYLAEAGLELGCAELNFPYVQGGSAFSTGNGWTTVGSGAYQKTVTDFKDSSGTTIGSLSVLVSGVNGNNPVIEGVGTATVSQGPATSRAVQTWLKRRGSFPYALAAKQQVKMNGGAYVDSFDSSDSAKSTGGAYDPAKRGANAVVVSADTSSMALQLGTIYGTATTSPLGGLTLSGSIGPTFDSSLRATTVATAELNGWVTHDLSLAVPDVTLPAGLGSAYNLGTISSAQTISSGDWQADSISCLNSTEPILISGQARLYVKGDFKTTGTGYLQISPGASLEVYVGGTVTIAGGGVVNKSGLAANNQWYGLTSSTDWKVAGGAEWLGTVYAPQASVEFLGISDSFGAFVANDFTISGVAGFHYDEALAVLIGGGQGYSVAAWQELRYVDGSWVP
jgi:hypothetical protein